ncbi:MAG: carbon starvation protein A [Bacteroidaceae bacterium]|nr:carbon starvation protein A [Bacteroidaceae bacterium]
MTSFLIGLLILVLGLLFYGRFLSKVVGIDATKATPAIRLRDGVDFVPMPAWKTYLVQFLNIAGTGPIFGAILGILYGPIAYIWIALGCVFVGAVHDFFGAVLSMRKNGASFPEIIVSEMGFAAGVIVRSIAVVLMVMVGAAFTMTPAALLASMMNGCGLFGSVSFWSVVIFGYYLFAALLPIDKVIGRIYPIFGIVLIMMALGLIFGIFTHSGYLPDFSETFSTVNPDKTALPMFPGVCVTICCGAVSGFHATQSPLMVRCIKNEKLMRPVFFGAMITEGLIAMIWAAATILFASSFGTEGSTPYEQLLNLLTDNGTHAAMPTILVNKLCHSWFGTFGAVIAILGVVAAPITTGDTALRSARLILSDALHISQRKIKRRIEIIMPIMGLSILLMVVEFQVLWRYFVWTNQVLATITLWAASIWLAKRSRHLWITLLPALWMTAVCVSYIFAAPEGFKMDISISNVIGFASSMGLLVWFAFYVIGEKKRKTTIQ